MKVIHFRLKCFTIVIVPTACFTKNDRSLFFNDGSFLGWVNVDFRHHKASVNLQCDTCDSKKTTLRLEGARMYTHSCARVCTREGTFRPPLFKIVIPCPYFFHFAQDRAVNSPYFARKTITTFISVFDIWRWRKWGWEDFVVQFFVIFFLFSLLSPHILTEPSFSAVDCFIPRISALHLHRH